MDHSEASRIARDEAINAFIAKLSPKRQARVSIVCGAIVEAGDPSGSLNLRFRSEQAHALALEIARNRGGALMGIREEVAKIAQQTEAVREIGLEIEAEGADFWERFELLQEREQWESDQQATAEYERWYLDKLSLEADAENLGAQ